MLNIEFWILVEPTVLCELNFCIFLSIYLKITAKEGKRIGIVYSYQLIWWRKSNTRSGRSIWFKRSTQKPKNHSPSSHGTIYLIPGYWHEQSIFGWPVEAALLEIRKGHSPFWIRISTRWVVIQCSQVCLMQARMQRIQRNGYRKL